MKLPSTAFLVLLSTYTSSCQHQSTTQDPVDDRMPNLDNLRSHTPWDRMEACVKITIGLRSGYVHPSEELEKACLGYVTDQTAEFAGCFISASYTPDEDGLTRWAELVAARIPPDGDLDPAKSIETYVNALRENCSRCTDEQVQVLDFFVTQLLMTPEDKLK